MDKNEVEGFYVCNIGSLVKKFMKVFVEDVWGYSLKKTRLKIIEDIIIFIL